MWALKDLKKCVVIQLKLDQLEWLLNKPYVNEVILRGQNLSLKCYQRLELLTYIERGIRSSTFHTGNKRMIRTWLESNLGRQVWVGAEAKRQTFSCNLQLWQLVTLQPFDLKTLYHFLYILEVNLCYEMIGIEKKHL